MKSSSFFTKLHARQYIANPIGDVLAHFGATMVGVSGSASSSSSTSTTSGLSRGNGLANAIAAQERNRGLLESVPNGVGHGIGRDTAGKPIIKVFVESDAPGARRALPRSIEGYVIQVVETGRFYAN